MYKLGIDVGGTNTDAVLIDENLNVIAADLAYKIRGRWSLWSMLGRLRTTTWARLIWRVRGWQGGKKHEFWGWQTLFRTRPLVAH